jgi:hypothetical protein
MPTLSKTDCRARVSQNEARRRKEMALCELRELDVAERKHNLIAADQVWDAWNKDVGNVRGAVVRIPTSAPAAAANTAGRKCLRSFVAVVAHGS